MHIFLHFDSVILVCVWTHTRANVCTLSCVWFFATPQIVAHQAALSMEFSRQKYWSGLPFPTPGDLLNTGIKPTSFMSPVLAGGFFHCAVWQAYSPLLFSCSIMSDSLRSYVLQHSRPPCPSASPEVSNSCPLSWWCHLIISSFITLFSSCLHSFQASGSFPMNWPFTSGGWRIGVSASASVLPVNMQDWSPLELTGLILLLYNRL